MPRPLAGDFGAFYQGYADLATGQSVAELLQIHPAPIAAYISALPEEKANYAYAEGKWTIKELVQHLIDTERIFAYRALRISRKDTTPLPGFDENLYAKNAPVADRSLADLKEEYLLVRKTTDLLLASFKEDQLQFIGNASGHPCTLNALCFIIFGHNLHHINILKERYF
ncbi:MAG: DNA damage-inducible protein DinB [Chitinophagaceae bacterium BSSC1]|nr:MAG: DNA damage-inducible protein DinB [Chitinophagaceae bacterium BSSC1]